jgi:hypothetical protein
VIGLLTCKLCGHEAPHGIRVALVEWKEPEPERFSAIPRCSDEAGCRARVAAEHEDWPLTEVEGVAR